MKKITEITTEREFVSKLRTYYRKARRKGYQRNEISFLGLMEYTGSATREFEYQSGKYFSVGIRAYDWQHGNSLLSALIDKWENEIEAEKRKKQPTQPTETPRISTETAETVNVSAEGENEPQAAKYKPYTTRAEIIALLESEHGIEYDAGEVVYLKDGCVAEDLSDEGEWRIYLDADSDKCIDVIAIQPPQSPETPQTGECPTNTPKPRETARKRPNRAIGSAQAARRNTLRDTLRSVTHVPRECSTTEASYW